MADVDKSDMEAIEHLKASYDKLKSQMHKVIVGQERVLDELLTCVFSRGHALLIGVPGLAKTLMIRTLAQCMELSFNRIQFTPDLMPSDITGTEVIQEEKATRQRTLKFIPGPVFSNVILADEINRTHTARRQRSGPPQRRGARVWQVHPSEYRLGSPVHLSDATTPRGRRPHVDTASPPSAGPDDPAGAEPRRAIRSSA